MSKFSPLRYRIAVAVFFYTCGAIYASWAARIPTLKDHFNLSEASLGIVLFMLPLGSLIALPFAGWLIAHFGSKKMVVFTSLLYGFILLSLAFWPSIFLLSAALFVFGFFGDLVNISVNTQALLVQEAYAGKPIMSSFHGMWSLGALTGAFGGGLLMKQGLTLQQHFMAVFIFVVILSVVFLFFLVPKDAPRNETQKIFAWPDRSLLLLGLICLCCAVCEGAMADWSSLYYKQVLHNVNGISTTGYTAFALLMAMGRMVGDRITSHLGYKGMLLLESIFIVSGLMLAILVQLPIAVIIGFAMVGFGVAAIIPIVYSLAGKSKTMAPGTALAAVSTLGFTGFLLGPPVIGFLAEAVTLRWALLFVVLMGMLIGVLSRRTSSKSTAQA